MAQKKNQTITSLVDNYTSYHFSEIKTNRFRHSRLMDALFTFESNPLFKIDELGKSEEGRSIKGITYGEGKTKVLLWSQMHGNESTATRAILDILHFLSANDSLNPLREQLSKTLTLEFIPMLNPDGSERFQRRTSTEIDMNRDAKALQTPEGRILESEVNRFKPHFAFNLHDQRRFYNVTGTGVPSSMSFLAPAYEPGRKINATRKKSMQIIAGMNKVLQKLIPGRVGLYDDTYSHRSFGDNIQAKGISTILVESGWMHNDMEKEGIRKLNFISILYALELIASDGFSEIKVDEYQKIPAIDTKLFDVLISNASLSGKSISKLDIGINRTEHLLEHPEYFAKGQIDDLGDLSSFFGFETIDAKGLTIVPGRSVVLESYDQLSMVTVKRWLRQGVLFVVTKDIPFEKHVPYPINIVHPRKLPMLQKPVFEGSADFLMVDKSNKIRHIVMNGFPMTPSKPLSNVNGLVIA